ncbi:hypothetical protein [Plantactinospora sp. KBS50]|uniref:hypothetical protein n=1 Tax=Plantactinospora sp. KBS50 TaxID=2024580 RepID=UPI000BAAB5B4|nr:hypothetical protein [Plantactinospora sp. KBS50]ASW57218.1 hypothetical protein CIK06_28380 [Plantactinospora sp. KBS50]
MKRWGVAVGTVLLAGVGALGLTGCGVAGRASDTAEQTAVEVAAAMGADGQALAAMGFDTAQIAAADPSADPSATEGAEGAEPSAGPGRGQRAEAWRKRHQARVLLRRNTLHGEVVVQTQDGTKTVAVQRGTVTAITDTSMTVKSTDGFTETWTFGPQLKVVERRTTIQPSDVKVGTELGVAGTRDGDNGVARLVVIPNKK